MQVKQLFRSVSGTSFLLTLARLTGAGIGILLQILIARFYGASELGTYYLALSLAAIFSIFISLGYPWIVAPIVARSESGKDPGALPRFLNFAAGDIIKASLLFCVPAAVLIWFYPVLGDAQRIPLLIGLATAPVFTVLRMNSGIANAFKFFQLANLPELLLRPLLTLAVILVAILLTYQLDAVSIVAINFLVTVGLTLWMTASLPKKARLNFSPATGAESLTGHEISSWRKLALPMVLSTLFVSMFADLDLLIIGMILPAHEAGIFGVCIKIAALLTFAVQVVHHLLLRDASDAHQDGNATAMHDIISKANRFALLASIGSLALILLFGDLVLSAFGSEFQAGYYCLTGLIAAQIIRAIAGPAIQMLVIGEKQRAGIPVYAVSVVVLIVSNLILVPRFGYEGAAAAVAITTLFWCVWLNRIVRRETGYSISAFGAI